VRHRVYGKKLGRTKNERTALFKSLVQELLLHGTITTSEAKAKAVRGLFDKIINLAKSKNTQRLLSQYLSPVLQERLVKEVAPKLDNRTSGYTSMIRMGVRQGDRTTVVKMSIIGAENLKPLEKVAKKVTAPKTEKKVEKTVTKKAAPVKKVTAKKKAVTRKRAKTK